MHPLALEAFPLARWDLPRAKPRRKSAERRLERLRLSKGQRIAYVFDYREQWRVRLTLRELEADDGGHYPRVVEAVGEAPPQYFSAADERYAA